MKFLDKIKEDTIVIVPNSLKDKVLNYVDRLNRLVPITLYSLEEVKKKLLFSYNEDAILYLMDKYHYKYEVSCTLLDNMYFVEDKNYLSNKLNKLVELKTELWNSNLLNQDILFQRKAKSSNVVVYGYDYLDNFQKRLLSCFKSVSVIESEIVSSSFKVFECNTALDEVNFVFSRIASLLKEGIDINKIKITNVDNAYHHALLTLSKFYKIPISVSLEKPIVSTKIGSSFVTLLENGSIKDAVDVLQKMVPNDEDTSKLVNKIISICNKYIDKECSFASIKEAITYELKHTSTPSVSLENTVEVVPFSNCVFDKDEYVFFVGFNQGATPSIKKDEDYISDNIKEEVGLSLTSEINTKRKEAFMNRLSSISNLVISYKLKTISEEFYPSNLIGQYSFEIEKPIVDTSASIHYSKILLGQMLDDLIKYDVKNSELDVYYSSLKIPYMTYDNKFTGLSKSSLLEHLGNKLSLSYTTIDNYYRCAFRYYLANVLKLDKYEDTFQKFIGNLFHYLLSKCLEDSFDFDKEWTFYISSKALTAKEEFFLVKLKEELKIIIEEVKRLHQETGLTSSRLEHKICIDKSRNIPIKFTGIIDKLMYKNVNGEDLVAIIDYKTGNPSTNLFNVIYGIDMQLPVYLYLVKYSTLFANPRFVGFYLQKILHGELSRSSNKTYLEQKKDNLKLVGYSTKDEGHLSRFDPTYEDSSFIKSMKITSKGFYHHAKVIEDEKIEALIHLVNEKIESAITDILDAKFDINPKRVGTENIGCSFCKFKDICYMREEDIVNLKEYKDFSFLKGGEEDA